MKCLIILMSTTACIFAHAKQSNSYQISELYCEGPHNFVYQTKYDDEGRMTESIFRSDRLYIPTEQISYAEDFPNKPTYELDIDSQYFLNPLMCRMQHWVYNFIFRICPDCEWNTAIVHVTPRPMDEVCAEAGVSDQSHYLHAIPGTFVIDEELDQIHFKGKTGHKDSDDSKEINCTLR